MNETRGSQRSDREIIARRKAASASRKISRPQALSIATQSLEVKASTVVGITTPVTELAMPVRAVTIPALVCSALWVAAACASEFVAGPIKVSSPWSRATPERAKVGGGFMTVTNTGKEEDRLIGASSEIAGSIEISRDAHRQWCHDDAASQSRHHHQAWHHHYPQAILASFDVHGPEANPGCRADD